MRQLSAPTKYKKYKQKVANALRDVLAKRSSGNIDKLDYLSSLSDDEFLRRWLWTVLIVGCPACFVAAPIVLSLVQPFLPASIAEIFWMIIKTLMGGLLLLLLLGIYVSLTWREHN